MSLQNLLNKYSLPNKVRVLIQHSEKGFIIKFPEYKGCITYTEDPLHINYKITDALLTYFEVPRHLAEEAPILYVPLDKISSKDDKPIDTNFSFFASLNSLNANNTRIR